MTKNNPFANKNKENEFSQEEQKFINENVDNKGEYESNSPKIIKNIVLDKSLKSRIEKYSKEFDRSSSYVIRMILNEYLSSKGY